MTIKWNAGQLFHCLQMVPPVQLESWSCLGKPQWSCSIYTEDPMPSAGSSSCPPVASITPEVARPRQIKPSGMKIQCFPCKHPSNSALRRPSSPSSCTLPQDTAGRGSGFLMEYVKLLLLPSPSRWEPDIAVHLTGNTINTINIHTYIQVLWKSVKDMRGAQSIQLWNTGKKVISKQSIVTVKWFT